MLSLTLLCYTQVHYYPHSQVWELRILVADWGDAGHYTCKTNTVPYRQELVTLVVRDTVAVIAGQEERIIKVGSRLLLHCVVELGKGPNKHFRSVAVLHWFVNQRLVDPVAGHEVGEMVSRVSRIKIIIIDQAQIRVVLDELINRCIQMNSSLNPFK